MSLIKEDLLYTKTNEWVKIEGNIATIGIDDYSQNEFGEVVFVDLPELNKEFKQDDEVCVVESVKTASDVCTPLTGKVIKVNENLNDTPNLVNSDCYNKGWIYQLEVSNESELNNLMNAEDYSEYLNEE